MQVCWMWLLQLCICVEIFTYLQRPVGNTVGLMGATKTTQTFATRGHNSCFAALGTPWTAGVM